MYYSYVPYVLFFRGRLIVKNTSFPIGSGERKSPEDTILSYHAKIAKHKYIAWLALVCSLATILIYGKSMYHTILSTSTSTLWHLRSIFCPRHHLRHRHPPDGRHRFGGAVRRQAQRRRHGANQGDGPGGGRVGPLARLERRIPQLDRSTTGHEERGGRPPHSPSHRTSGRLSDPRSEGSGRPILQAIRLPGP